METFHLWLGNFSSADILEEYFVETYDEDDDSIPINQFAADQGEIFYDHDFVECSYSKASALHDLIVEHFCSNKYRDDIIVAASALNIKAANTFIMADSAEISSPRSVSKPSYQLWYLGKFQCSCNDCYI